MGLVGFFNKLVIRIFNCCIYRVFFNFDEDKFEVFFRVFIFFRLVKLDYRRWLVEVILSIYSDEDRFFKVLLREFLLLSNLCILSFKSFLFYFNGVMFLI